MEHIAFIMGQQLGNRHVVLWLRRPPFDKHVTGTAMALSYVIKCVAAVSMALWLLVAPAQAQQRRTLPGHVPAAAHGQPVDRLPGSTRLNLAIGLPLRNPEALTKLLQQIYDPASPQYRQYLTPEQFTEKFGPTEQDYQAVVDFANRNGFRITATHPNRVLLDVNAAVADIEKALHVTMRVYRHPTEGRRFYAPDVEPSVRLDLPVLDISGLNNYARPHPANLKMAPHQATRRAHPADGSGVDGNYMGYDFRAAYAPGVSLTGSGQTIGLVQFDGYYPDDITAYESAAGLPSVTLTNVYIDGFDGTPDTNEDFVAEVSLDIEMSVSMAPGLSKVILYEAGPDGIPNDILNRMATDNQARQLSCSWGWGGGPDPTADEIFQQMAAQGQSFFAASGDSDAYITSTSTNFPADDPYITIVGGTTLTTTGPVGPWVSETVWNWGVEFGSTEDGVGSSGGISTSYEIPSWQQGLDMGGNGGSTTMRNVPDVALTADNVYVIANNGTEYPGVGGTSCASPLWAAFTALVNEQAATNGMPAVGFINPAVYLIGTELDYASDFQDITTGNNEWIGSPNQFSAVAGYDLCTGWGTPMGSNLVNALSRPPDALRIRPVTGFTASGPVGGPFNITSQSYALSNAGTTTLSWSLLNTTAWLSASSSSGTLTAGGPANTVTVSLNSAANSLGAGVYSGSVRFTDLNSGAALHRQFTLRVGQPLVQNGDFETGDFSFWTLTGDPSSGSSYVDDGSLLITPYDGNYAAVLSEAGSVAYLSQTLPTLPGQAYVLSFWLENADFGFGTKPNEFLVLWNGTTISSHFNMPASDWTYYQSVVVATGNSSVLQFGFRNNLALFGLDDVRVTPVSKPVFQSVTRSNNNIGLTWSTVAGLVYQVQYSASLTPTNWINVGGTLTASGSSLSASVAMGTATQRFYRVRVAQ